MHLLPTFLPDQVMSRRGVTGDQMIDQQPGRVIGPGEGVFLATDASAPPTGCLPVHMRQPLRGQPVQPGIERQWPFAL